MFDKRSIIILAVVSAVILSLLLYVNSLNRNVYDWDENYNVSSKEPNGAFAFHEFVKDYFPDHEMKDLYKIMEELPETTDEKSNYILLGYGMYLDTARSEKLLKFVENGNNAFIMANYVPADLFEHFLDFNECDFDYRQSYDQKNDSMGTLSLIHPKLITKVNYKFVRDHKTTFYKWHFINWGDVCYEEPDFLELGYVSDDLPNFVRVPHGEGYFYFHTTPYAFTNYQLLKKRNRKYASRVLAHLEEGPIYYDIENNVNYVPTRIADAGVGEADEMFDGQKAAFDKTTPLQFILSHRGLAWAWYLMVGLSIFYMFFRAKRKQRIIPVIEPNTNTSLEFVETIGMLHWQQNDHRQLSLQQMKLFINYINARYHFSIKTVDNKLLSRLSVITEIPEKHLKTIFDDYKNIKNSSAIAETEMMAFHQSIDYFYKNCK